MGSATANERLPRPQRRIEDADVVCEAGRCAQVGEAVLCKITETLVSARKDPRSLMAFCLGDPTQCPVWRAEKDAIAARRRGALDGGRA